MMDDCYDEQEFLKRSSARIGENVGNTVIYHCLDDVESALHGMRCYICEGSEEPLSLDGCRDPGLAATVFSALRVIEQENVLPMADSEIVKDACRRHYRAALEALLEKNI
jgi:hypothetical protein